MITKPSPWLRLLLCALLLLVHGCAARHAVTYYNLTPQPPDRRVTEATEANARLAIGVGPVSLPESVSRSQIALRLDAQSLRFDDYHRWSNPLADDFAQVLLDDLATRLPTDSQMALFPWGKYFQPSHRIVVNVSHFDGALAGEVELKARWTITNGTAKESLAVKQSRIRVKVAGGEYQDLVTAHSRAVAQLAEEMAAALAAH